MWAAKGPVSSSNLYEINPSDGSTITNVGSIGFGLTGMANDPTTGTLYGVTSNSSTSPRRLITISKATGAGTIVGQLLQGGVARTIADIGFASTGQLWGFNVSQNRICQINKATGAVTNIGGTSESGSGNGMDLDWQDDYFLLPDQSSGILYQIDTGTGVSSEFADLDEELISDTIPAACFAGDKFYAVIQDTFATYGSGNPVLATVAGTGHVTLLGEFDEPDIDALASDVTKTQWYQPPVILDAEDYANLSSPTVSLQGGSPQWVRDEQYREYDFVNFDSMKGPFDYTHSLIIPAGTVPSGRYRLELYNRFGNIASSLFNEDVIVQLRQGPNDMPLNPSFGTGLGSSITNGVELWRTAANETGGYPIFPPIGTSWGGPLFVDTSKDVYICWGQTSEEESSPGIPQRYMEVKQVRFTAVANEPLPSRRWIAMKHGGEPWGFIIEGQTRCREKHDGSGFYVSYHSYNNVSSTAPPRFTVWEYSLNGDAIELVDSRGLGDQDLKVNSATSNDGAIYWHDFCVMPNGDIYLVAFERTLLTAHWLWVRKWDGATWTDVETDLGGAGEGTNHWRFSCSIDTDGTDVWIAWGELKTAGSDYATDANWGWRCVKYDVGGNTFTELGTSLGAGISAYQSRYDNDLGTIAGNAEHPVKMRVSPGGVPWVAWNEFEVGSTTNPTKNDLPWLYYWDGAAWQDAGLTPPTTPPTATGHSYSSTPSGGGNYSRTTDDEVDAIDMVFCHSDGPSEYPAVCWQWTWDDQLGLFDYIEFVYKEYNGTSWQNEIRMPSLSQWPELEEFVDPSGGLLGQHWHGGFQLDDNGQTPYLFAQMARGAGTLIAVAAAKLVGTAFESLGGDEFPSYLDAAEGGFVNFVDYPINPGPLQDGGNWVDDIEAGLIVNGRPVGVFHWWNGWLNAGVMCTLWVEGGGNVSMNWRSADRRGAANRVLIGR